MDQHCVNTKAGTEARRCFLLYVSKFGNELNSETSRGEASVISNRPRKNEALVLSLSLSFKMRVVTPTPQQLAARGRLCDRCLLMCLLAVSKMSSTKFNDKTNLV